MADRRTTPQVIDFETFATQRGASRLGYCHDGAVSPAGHMPKSNWRRLMQALAERNAELAKRRHELREEYQRLVAEGKVRPPSRIEELLVIAMAMRTRRKRTPPDECWPSVGSIGGLSDEQRH